MAASFVGATPPSKIPVCSTTRVKSAIVFSLMVDGSNPLDCRIFGRLRPVRIVRKRSAIRTSLHLSQEPYLADPFSLEVANRMNKEVFHVGEYLIVYGIQIRIRAIDRQAADGLSVSSADGKRAAFDQKFENHRHPISSGPNEVLANSRLMGIITDPSQPIR